MDSDGNQLDKVTKREVHPPHGRQEDNRVRHRVEVQTLQIERFLSKHNIKAEVDGGSVRTDWVDFDLRSHLSEGWQRLSKVTNGLVGALGVPEVRISRDNGNLRLMVRKDSSHPVDLLDLLAASPQLSGGEVILGIDEEGRPVILDLFTNEMSNILVTGQDGAGKSGLLRSIAVSLAISSRQSDIQLCIISAGTNSNGLFSKSNQLLPLNYLPHLQFPVSRDIDEAADALSFLADEIMYRDEAEIDTPKLVVLVDDADWLVEKGGQRIVQPLVELLEASEETGLRLVFAAAEPNQVPLAQLMRYGAQLRLVGRVSDADHAFLYTGEDSTGAENLNGRGDFLAVSYGQIIRFQSAYIDDYDLHLMLSELQRNRRKILIAKQKKYPNERISNSEEEETRFFTVDGEDGRISFTGEPNSKAYVIEGQVIEPLLNEDMKVTLVGEEEALTFSPEKEPVIEIIRKGELSEKPRQFGDDSQVIRSSSKQPSAAVAKMSRGNRKNPQEPRDAEQGREDDFSAQSLPLELEYSDIDDEQWVSAEESEEGSDDNNRYH